MYIYGHIIMMIIINDSQFKIEFKSQFLDSDTFEECLRHIEK